MSNLNSRNLKKEVLVFFAFLFLLVNIGAACSTAKPLGPAERIGRSIDELSKGIKDLGDEWDEEDEEREKERRERQREDYYGDDYYDDDRRRLPPVDYDDRY